MMNTIYDYEDISLFGGILGEVDPWGGLEGGSEKVGESTLTLQTAPSSGGAYGVGVTEMNFEAPSPNSNWILGDYLEDFVNNDFLKVEPSSVEDQMKLLPPSPTGSMDSGVASPGSSISSYSNVGSPPVLDFTEPEGNLYPNLGDFDADLLLKELGIEILDELEVPIVIPEPVISKPVEVLPTLKHSELSALLTGESTYRSVQPAVKATPIAAKPVVSTTPKARTGRKSKVTSTMERKERKREQNKNAAIRYREKKRRENSTLDGEYDLVKMKNTQLNDKVKQVSREINYLRELMIEVYRIKGLIA